MYKKQPKQSLIDNLNYLMRYFGYSQSELARRSGVAQKTINNIMNGRNSPSLDTVEELAKCFGLTLWHLIMPDLPQDLISSPSLEKMIQDYIKADPKAREYIDYIASKEAQKDNSK